MSTKRKSEGLAILFNFLFTGAGHIYASGGQRVGLLIAALICGATVPFLYVTIIGNLVMWIVGMATGASVAREYNEALDAEEESLIKEARRNEIDRIEMAKLISGSTVATEIAKLANLKSMNIISADEFRVKKNEFIRNLLTNRVEESMADFFMPLGTMVQDQTLELEELEKLKTVYSQIFKSDNRGF